MCESELEQIKQENRDLMHRIGELEAQRRDTNVRLDKLESILLSNLNMLTNHETKLTDSLIPVKKKDNSWMH